MSADPRQVLVWREHALFPEADDTARLLVADSFLVADGGVAALDRHRSRFLFDVGRPEIEALAGRRIQESVGDVEAFWTAAVAALPDTGSWFPRIELAATEREVLLRLRVRPAPPLTRTVTLSTWSEADPRHVPGVKGPDLEALLRARSAVAAEGADDGVLLAGDGSVADGTTSALLWWRGDRLCVPAEDVARVASVTAAGVLALAAAAGIEVVEEHARPADLDGLEVWTANALHGIRGVERWIGGPSVSLVPGRLDSWRRRLEAQRSPIRPAAPRTPLP